jgi:type IV pilus assembly protein PilC
VARYEYIAKNTLGVETSSVLHAESPDAAADLLHRDGLVVLSIREAKESVRTRLSAITLPFTSNVSQSAVSLFTKQLSSMVHAGLPLIRALYSLSRDEHNKALSKVLVSVASDIESGESLSNALEKHPRVFSKIYVSMVRSGERSGTLDVIMNHLVRYMHRTEAIKRKVRAALTYPTFVVGFAIVAFLVLMLRVVPMMAGIYDKLGAELPGPTKMLIAISHFGLSYFWVFLILLAGLIAGYTAMRRNPQGKFLLDSWKLRIPIFGKLVNQVVIAKFLRTLGVVVVSGLPILDSLELAGSSAGNEVVDRASGSIARQVSKGANLSAAFHGAHVFPEIVVQMVSTGEETGNLGDMLSAISDHYDEQVETSVEGLASIIEPLMIVLVGGLIALMLVAMFLPVFHLGGAIRHSM